VLGRGTDLLPLREPTGGVVLSGHGRDDLCPGEIGRAGDLRPFAGQVVNEVNPLGGTRRVVPCSLVTCFSSRRGPSVKMPLRKLKQRVAPVFRPVEHQHAVAEECEGQAIETAEGEAGRRGCDAQALQGDSPGCVQA